MAIDFRASQFRGAKFISSGSTGTGAKILFYDIAADSATTPNIGVINTAKFATGSIGTDIFLYVSGSIGTAGVPNSQGTTVFGGDVVVSGNLILSGNLASEIWVDNNNKAYTTSSIAISSLPLANLAFHSDVIFFVSGGINQRLGSTRAVSLFLGDTVTSGSSIVFRSLSQGYENITDLATSHAEGFRTTASNEHSHAEGNSVAVTGPYSHGEGFNTLVSSTASHAEGFFATASANYSHAEGNSTLASGLYSHAEGFGTLTIGEGAHAQGIDSVASGAYSHVGGIQTIASGTGQTIFGKYNTRNNIISLFVIGNGTSNTARKDILTINPSTVAIGSGSIESDVFLFVSGGIGDRGVSSAQSITAFGGDVHISGNLSVAGAGAGNSFWQSTTLGVIFTTSSIVKVTGSVQAQSLSASVGATITGTLVQGSGVTATGTDAHAQGEGTLASGVWSHAEGSFTTASFNFAHAEGTRTVASGESAHAEGFGTLASNNYSHAEGNLTTASNLYSHAEGEKTLAAGASSHAEGFRTTASLSYAHAEGYSTLASGAASHTEGVNTTSSNDYSHAEGEGTRTAGVASHAEGYYTFASGSWSHSEGYFTVASGSYSHAEGQQTTASGDYSHAEGLFTFASGAHSHAEGRQTKAGGIGAHAAGFQTTASGDYSYAAGNQSLVIGAYSFGVGSGAEVSGAYSFGAGFGVVVSGASGFSQTVFGKYNKQKNAESLFIVGNGTDSVVGRKDIFLINTGTMMIGSGSIGQDVFLFVSGGIGQRLGTTASVALFGGDLHISGNLTVAGTGGGNAFWESTANKIIFNTGSIRQGTAVTIDLPTTNSVILSSQGSSRTFGGISNAIISSDASEIRNTSGTPSHVKGNTIISDVFSDIDGDGAINPTLNNVIAAGGANFIESGSQYNAVLGSLGTYLTSGSTANGTLASYDVTLTTTTRIENAFGCAVIAGGPNFISSSTGDPINNSAIIGSNWTVTSSYTYVIGDSVNQAALLVSASRGVDITGQTKFFSGLSGSHQRLTNGTPAFVSGGNVQITTQSNGAVAISGSATYITIGSYTSTTLTSSNPQVAGQAALDRTELFNVGNIYLRNILSTTTGSVTASLMLYNITSGAYVHIGGPSITILSTSNTTPTLKQSVNLLNATNFITGSDANIYEVQVYVTTGSQQAILGSSTFVCV